MRRRLVGRSRIQIDYPTTCVKVSRRVDATGERSAANRLHAISRLVGSDGRLRSDDNDGMLIDGSRDVGVRFEGRR